MNSAPALSAPETVFANLRMILRGLMAALGAWRVETAVALVLHRRIGATLGRIERMLIRFRAGRLWRMPPRAARLGAIRKSNCTLPRRFGWLVQAGGHRAAVFGTQLQAVLLTPEMAALLAESAQAGRLLRPLCRALAVEMPGPVAPQHKAATVHGETSAGRPRTRAKPEPFRIPLPRGVLAAARREGFGKDHHDPRGEAGLMFRSVIE